MDSTILSSESKNPLEFSNHINLYSMNNSDINNNINNNINSNINNNINSNINNNNNTLPLKPQQNPLQTLQSLQSLQSLQPNRQPVIDLSRNSPNKNLSHVPCKFFKQGICQAGKACPFSHSIDPQFEQAPCKYFQKGNCKFGAKCALAHILPDGRRVTPRQLSHNIQYNNHQVRDSLNQSNYISNPSGLSRSLALAKTEGTNFNHQYLDPNTSATNNVPTSIPNPPSSSIASSLYRTNPSVPINTRNEFLDNSFSSINQNQESLSSSSRTLGPMDVMLPPSLDYENISYYARHGPVANSLPSKFGLNDIFDSHSANSNYHEEYNNYKNTTNNISINNLNQIQQSSSYISSYTDRERDRSSKLSTTWYGYSPSLNLDKEIDVLRKHETSHIYSNSTTNPLNNQSNTNSLTHQGSPYNSKQTLWNSISEADDTSSSINPSIYHNSSSDTTTRYGSLNSGGIFLTDEDRASKMLDYNSNTPSNITSSNVNQSHNRSSLAYSNTIAIVDDDDEANFALEEEFVPSSLNELLTPAERKRRDSRHEDATHTSLFPNFKSPKSASNNSNTPLSSSFNANNPIDPLLDPAHPNSASGTPTSADLYSQKLGSPRFASIFHRQHQLQQQQSVDSTLNDSNALVSGSPLRSLSVDQAQSPANKLSYNSNSISTPQYNNDLHLNKQQHPQHSHQHQQSQHRNVNGFSYSFISEDAITEENENTNERENENENSDHLQMHFVMDEEVDYKTLSETEKKSTSQETQLDSDILVLRNDMEASERKKLIEKMNALDI